MRKGFEQLSSSIDWRVTELKTLIKNVTAMDVKGLNISCAPQIVLCPENLFQTHNIDKTLAPYNCSLSRQTLKLGYEPVTGMSNGKSTMLLNKCCKPRFIPNI